MRLLLIFGRLLNENQNSPGLTARNLEEVLLRVGEYNAARAEAYVKCL
jgi:hypothetical protein